MILGDVIRGSVVLQDPKKEYFKLQGVVLGEKSKFSLSVINNRSIGIVLDEVLKDARTVAVVYNWGTGVGYVKSGFDLTDDADSATNKDYTTFIVKARIPKSIAPFSTSHKRPSGEEISTQSDFVRWNGTNFTLKGKKFYPVGPNIYWLGFQENYEYPNRRQIEEMFKVAQNMNATCIRSHTLGVSSGHSKSLLETNFSAAAMEPIDYTFYMAAQYKIKLIVPLTDNYFYYHGDYSHFCTKRGKTKKDFWWDYTLRSDFKQYIRKWLEHTNRYTKLKVKDDPSLFLIELGNELGNIRRDNDSVPPKEWIEDITRFVKTIDTSHMILDGSDECLGKSDNFNISTIDAYRSNFYGKDYGRMDGHASSAMAKRKPFLVTEFDSKFEDEFLKHIERNKNINGSFWWCLYGKDDNGKYIRHDDGYTQYYKEPGSFNNLLRLTNHARRLQSLPEVTSLP